MKLISSFIKRRIKQLEKERKEMLKLQEVFILAKNSLLYKHASLGVTTLDFKIAFWKSLVPKKHREVK